MGKAWIEEEYERWTEEVEIIKADILSLVRRTEFLMRRIDELEGRIEKLERREQ